MGTLAPLALALTFTVPTQESDDTARSVDELLLRYAANGWSGAALVARGGEALIAKGYGFADFDGERVNTERTLFEIASITKSFTAAAILKLEEQGQLSLDDPIAVHLPGVPPHSRKITIHQLLSHTSGVPGQNASGRGEDLAKVVVDYLGSGPRDKPGSKWEYWNGGYALLAGIVEQASGEPYTRFCEEQLFAPAGMSETGFTGDQDLEASRAAIGRSSQGAPRSALEHPYGAYGYQYRGMGGIVTHVLDLLKWDRALAGTAVLGEASKTKLFAPVANGYACGWFVDRAANGGGRLSHGGSVRGFTADFRRFPAQDACIAVLSNTDDAHSREIAENLECLLFGRPLAHPAPKTAPLAWDEAQAFAGIYAGEAGRLVVRAAAGAVLAGIEGQELLEKTTGPWKLDWKADRDELNERAVAIVEAIARGNTEPLRTAMAPRIPKSWPDTVRRQIWPAQESLHGALKGVRSIGALVRNERVEVVLALEHERSSSRALVAFGPAGLELLDWQGPQFAAVVRLTSLGRGVFTTAVEGDTLRFEFEREGATARRVRVAGLRLDRE